DLFNTTTLALPFQAAGLDTYAHIQTPVGNSTWPTLRQMIRDNKRLVVFVDEGDHQAAIPWLHSEYDYVWETPYSFYVNTVNFNCSVDRPPFNPQLMQVMNHFVSGNITIWGMNLEVPTMNGSIVANQLSSLQSQLN